MTFYPGMTVRIRRDAKPATDELARLRGEIAHIVGPYAHGQEQWYQLDISTKSGPVGAAESALEPIWDEPVKLSWNDTSGRIVWRPREMEPAVIRRRVRA